MAVPFDAELEKLLGFSEGGGRPPRPDPENGQDWRAKYEEDLFCPLDPTEYESEPEFLYDLKYCWREDCADGSAYGIDPQDYETEAEYEQAIREAADRRNAEAEWKSELSGRTGPEEPVYQYCGVMLTPYGRIHYYMIPPERSLPEVGTVFSPQPGKHGMVVFAGRCLGCGLPEGIREAGDDSDRL